MSAVLLGGALSAVQAQTAITVPVVSVQAQSVGQGFELDGTLQAVRQSTVSAQVPGRLMTLAVKAGDKVRAGQLLATLDDREAQSGVQRSQAQMAQAQAELHNAQAQFERTQELRRQGFISAAALDTAQAQLKAAQAGRDQASAGGRQASLSQGFTRVTAPFDALVLQTHVELGTLAMPGTPILTLYAPTPVRAVVQVPLSRAKQLGAAPQIEVQLPGADGSLQWIRPTQSRPLPSADPVSQTVEWRLDLPSTASQYASIGQQLRVRFAAGQAQRTTVPSSAVLRRGELTAVYVAQDKGFALKAVRLGADHGAQGVEVLAGLAANDRVAVDPVRAGLQGAQPAVAQ
ncbi:MAG: efflux transporter periplasmic adaptor subunit [Comamonadaceae bacterium CG12_big_fil_rev_8_21_14_0_65_59_15]|nr:MAG: efflux transporter periplasmic adaptor subunit [Comamonadaceae bacterium CG12_big_fil_rev_8_21_14_0_65_59_15]